MNRAAKKELRNRGLRARKTTAHHLTDAGVFSLLESALLEEQSGIRKAFKGEKL